jgi:PAS domain S-box-containing protein
LAALIQITPARDTFMKVERPARIAPPARLRWHRGQYSTVLHRRLSLAKPAKPPSSDGAGPASLARGTMDRTRVAPASKTILIVEDDDVVAEDLQRSLRDMGYDVPAVAAGGVEAIRVAQERCPALVLMDIRIRGALDGIQTGSILRDRLDVPVIYLTGYTDAETLARAKRTQPYGYLVKPVKVEELRSAVEIALYKHEMERRLRERERWFATTLRSIGDAVVSTDVHGRVTFMNAVAETLTGWRSEDATGQRVLKLLRLVDESSNAEMANPVELALRARRTVNLNAVLVHRDGGRREIAASAAPIVDDAHCVLGAVLVFQDVSQRRRMERQLELTDRLASLGTMAAGVAHEINNPLAFIGTNLSFALETLQAHAGEQAWSEELCAALGDAHVGAERVRRIVADLSTFARPPGARTVRARVERTLEWAIAITHQEVDARARLVVDIGATPLVAGDETRLGQVFVNLIINAAHAIPEGARDGHEIRVRSTVDWDGMIVVDVEDTGCGMSATILRSIFDPFFTTKAMDRGTGLGLSICHGIVTSFGGTIEVESRVGVGSRFRVRLPVAATSEPPPATDAAPRTETRRRGNLLLVDDEAMVLTAIARLLGADHRVTLTTAGAEAVALLERGARFDLILCDLMMPGTNGMDLYDRLLGLAPDQARRMVFMTGGTYTPRSIEFLRAVENRCIEKPFDAELLTRTIQDELAASGPHRPGRA